MTSRLACARSKSVLDLAAWSGWPGGCLSFDQEAGVKVVCSSSVDVACGCPLTHWPTDSNGSEIGTPSRLPASAASEMG